MSPELFPIFIAACVALLVWGLTELVRDWMHKDQRKLARRLAGTSGSVGAPSGSRSVVLTDLPEGLPPFLAANTLIRTLHRQLLHAYPDWSFVRFLVISAASSLIGAFAMWIVTDTILFALVGLSLGGYAPLFLVLAKKARRQRILSEQLPEALE